MPISAVVSSSSASRDRGRASRAVTAPCSCFGKAIARYSPSVFAKGAQAKISKADLALLKEATAEALGWSGEELDRLIVSGVLVEIEDEHED